MASLPWTRTSRATYVRSWTSTVETFSAVLLEHRPSCRLRQDETGLAEARRLIQADGGDPSCVRGLA